jgi:hypothetical protein
MEAEMIDRRVVDVIYSLGRETDTPQKIVKAVVRNTLPSIRLLAQFPKGGKKIVSVGVVLAGSLICRRASNGLVSPRR